MSADAREARIRALLPIVKQIARRVHRMVPMSDLDDLIGDGCVGLIRAVDGFDPSRGVPLEHYARKLVSGAVLNGVRRMDPVPERMRRTMRAAGAARYALAQQLGTVPSMNEMSRRLPELTAARTEVHRRTPLSLDVPLPRGERLDIDHSGDPQSVVAVRGRQDAVYGAIAELPQRQRTIVLAHYFADRKLRELVEPMQISPQRVSQLHLLALKRMRATIAPQL
ncbi:MAG TPA: sigma-70 family RNA polymerase sigma factor [Candidatus Elarobacter sp.]|jgi:RNA polymerase sigma factor for flagellar operon FliA